MKRLFLLIAMLLCGHAAFAVSGHITASTTWSGDVLITGDVWIDQGVTLTLDAGTRVLFPKVDANVDNIGDFRFVINGALQANGTSASPIYFLSNETTPHTNDWYGLVDSSYGSNQMSTLNYVNILHAYRGMLVDADSLTVNYCWVDRTGEYGFRVTRSIATSMNHTVVFGSGTYGVRVEQNSNFNGNSINVVNCKLNGIEIFGNGNRSIVDSYSVSNEMTGLLCDGSAPVITNSTLSYNSFHGLNCTNGANPIISYCNLKSNVVYGAYVFNASPTITYCDIVGNLGLGLYFASSQAHVNYCNITDNASDTNSTMISTNGTLSGNRPWNGIAGSNNDYGGTVYLSTSNYSSLISTGASIIATGNCTTSGGASIRATFTDGSNYQLSDTSVNIGNYFVPTLNTLARFSRLTSNTSINVRIHYGGNNLQRTFYWDIPQIQIKKTTGLAHCAIWNNSSSIVMLQNNWWGRIFSLDTLIYQDVIGTAVYSPFQSNPNIGVGSNQVNTYPSLSFTSPITFTQTSTTQNISWSAFDLEDNATIRLYYCRNTDTLGLTGTQFSRTYQAYNDTNAFTWDVSAIPNGVYRIYARINDGTNPDVLVYAPGTVVIGKIVIFSPNGGETFRAATTDSIRWGSADVTGNVRVELNRSFPSSAWEPIQVNAPNTGACEWTRTEPMTATARIRILSINNTIIGDTTDANFTITPSEVEIVSPNGGESFTIGFADTIRWLIPAIPGNVRIELNRSYPNGTWESLFSDTDNDGIQLWTTAAPPTTSARLRIIPLSDTTRSDTSEFDFTIGQPIKLTRPNGSEILVIGASDTIKWTSSRITGNVNIRFKRNYPSGPWTTIANNVPISQGYFEWTPTTPITSNARILLSPVNFPSLADTSDANFSIMNPTVTIAHPIGGERIIVGIPDTIRWSASYNGDLQIYLYRNGQSDPEPVVITDSVPSQSGVFVWTPTAPVSDSAYLYISDSYYPVATWSQKFRIVNSTIDVIRPNDGEVFYYGLPDSIKWSSVNLTGNVAVDLRRTVTGSWETIRNSVANTGYTRWQPTGTSTISAKVRVRSLTDPGTSDTSDFAFSIQNYPWSTLLSYLARNPHAQTNNRDEWIPEIPYDISTSNLAPVELHFPNQPEGFLNPDSLRASYTTFSGDEVGSNRTVNRKWSVVPSTEQFSGADLTLRFTRSDLPSSIVAPDSVYPPLRAIFTDDDESTWIFIPGGTVYRDTAGSGNSFKFVVEDLNHMSEWALTNDGLKPVLTYPNGNDTIHVSDTIQFQWSNSIRGGSVSIELNRNYPTGSWEILLANTPNDSSESWVVTGPLTNNARFRIVSEWFPTDGDTTNAATILRSSAASAGIGVVYPNGGEILRFGSMDTLRWYGNGFTGNVCIEVNLSYPTGTWDTLFANAENTGAIAWSVSDILTTHARLRISSINQPEVTAISTSDFSIQPAAIVLQSPNGGEVWRVGDVDTIRWNSFGLAGNVQIELNRNYPTGAWETITATTENDGSEPWLVTGQNSLHTRIRIVSELFPTIGDTSNADFELYRRGIQVIYPNGKEILTLNVPDTIRWITHEYSGNVQLKYTRDYPNPPWLTVTGGSNIPASQGFHVWTPTGFSSNNARIAIIPLSEPAIGDTSDAAFSIQTRQLTLTYPNHGETFLLGRPDTIRWLATYTSNVCLYLLRNGMPGSEEIIDDGDTIPARRGYYVWTPTGSISDNAYFHIVDYSYGLEDVTDVPFRIASAAITVTKPNDGETYYFGLPDSIQWSSYNLAGNVAIDLRRTVTGLWESIVAEQNNTGGYLWTPSGSLTSSAKVRIRSIVDPTVADTSDFPCSISYYPWSATSFSAHNPNAAVNRQAAWIPTLPIDQASGNRPPLQIAFSEQPTGFANPSQIVASYVSVVSDQLAAGSFITRFWTISPASDNFTNATVTLRFLDTDVPFTIIDPIAAEPSLRAVSSLDGMQTWSLLGDGEIARDIGAGNSYTFSVDSLNRMGTFALTNVGLRPELTYPNGGETLTIGETVTFRWTNAIRGGTVSIAINRTYPSGEWETILSNTPNDSLEQWLVSGDVTTTARFRIASEWFASDGDTCDSDVELQSGLETPASPTSLQLQVTNVNAILRWSPVTTSLSGRAQWADGYLIDFRVQGYGEWQPLGITSSTFDTTYVDSNAVQLSPQKYYQVRAFKAGGAAASSTGVRISQPAHIGIGNKK
ncbi:MAG: right-handed parallel beta-helix repeat-containing protein [bacterium]|nr:right-handed parallel beta-helix repeat-containing protein [bacterium]